MKRIWQKAFTLAEGATHVDQSASFRRAAFTLAEVLITLGIIGIVAAMTIPTLMQKTQDAELKTAWKKEFSTLSNAYDKMKADNGGDLSQYLNRATGSNNNSDFIEEYTSYFSASQRCNYVTFDICGTTTNYSKYTTLSGGSFYPENLGYGNTVLNDGANVFFRTYQQGFFLVFVDVNGFWKKPNVLGKDLFGATITKDKIMPMGALGTGVEDTCNSTEITCPGGPYGFHGTGSCAGAGCSSEYLMK